MKCKYFNIKELVSEDVYNDRGEKAWELLDPSLLSVIDRLRDKYGVLTINNWSWGGNRSQSGLRTASSKYYSPYSMHSFGRAVDIIPKYTPVSEIREYLLSEAGRLEFPEIKGIELEVTWLHIDVRNRDELLAFRP